jgi:hypothetical protein
MTAPPVPEWATQPTSLERYVEKVRVTQWRNDCVYRTESLGTGWFPESAITANVPQKTWILYVAASDEFARTHMTIRRATPG